MTKPSTLSRPRSVNRRTFSKIYGAGVTCFSSPADDPPEPFGETDPISCLALLLIHETICVTICNRPIVLQAGDLLVLTPPSGAGYRLPTGAAIEGLLLDASFYPTRYRPAGDIGDATTHNLYHLPPEQADELSGLFLQIKLATRSAHIRKAEIVAMLVDCVLLFINGLQADEPLPSIATGHKATLFNAFLRLASAHFREERQIPYYADKLCISSTYLSRVVKELSGLTIGDHLARLTFSEACSLLAGSDKTVGEIAYLLSFNDQPAFTRFFKQRAGVTPAGYRKRMTVL